MSLPGHRGEDYVHSDEGMLEICTVYMKLGICLKHVSTSPLALSNVDNLMQVMRDMRLANSTSTIALEELSHLLNILCVC